MKLTIIGDQSKMIDNFTRVMCEITLEHIKNSIRNGTIDELVKKVERSKDKTK